MFKILIEILRLLFLSAEIFKIKIIEVLNFEQYFPNLPPIFRVEPP